MGGTVPTSPAKVNSGTSYFPQGACTGASGHARLPCKTVKGLTRPAAVLGILAALALGVAPAAAAELQPDLDMRSPWQLQLTTDGAGRSFVAFASEVDNRG